MAGEVTVRKWWLIIRRYGHVVKKIPVRILPLVRDGVEIDPYADQAQISPDFDIIDEIDGMTTENRVASYELISTTSSFEINSYE